MEVAADLSTLALHTCVAIPSHCMFVLCVCSKRIVLFSICEFFLFCFASASLSSFEELAGDVGLAYRWIQRLAGLSVVDDGNQVSSQLPCSHCHALIPLCSFVCNHILIPAMGHVM